MIVNDIEQHGQSAGVTGVDEAFESFRSAVSMMRSEQTHAVVTPAVVAGEFVGRHQFDVRNAKLNQMIQLFNCRIKCARRGECSDVEFVNDGLRQRRCLEAGVGPFELAVNHKTGKPVNSIGLPRRARVGKRSIAVEKKPVMFVGGGRLDFSPPPTVIATLHRQVLFVAECKLNFLWIGCPNADRMHGASYRGFVLPTKYFKRSAELRFGAFPGIFPTSPNWSSALQERPAKTGREIRLRASTTAGNRDCSRR